MSEGRKKRKFKEEEFGCSSWKNESVCVSVPQLGFLVKKKTSCVCVSFVVVNKNHVQTIQMAFENLTFSYLCIMDISFSAVSFPVTCVSWTSHSQLFHFLSLVYHGHQKQQNEHTTQTSAPVTEIQFYFLQLICTVTVWNGSSRNWWKAWT